MKVFMSSKSFTAREWVFTLILTSIVQAFVWYASFVNSGNSSALTYVSFAGTLISIILAVLAIGYTYGESQVQKNKSDNVSEQIGVLNEVIRNVKLESESLNDITKISNQLEALALDLNFGLKSSENAVNAVQSGLVDLQSALKSNTTNSESTSPDTHGVFEVILSSDSLMLIISYLLIYETRGNVSVMQDRVMSLIEKYNQMTPNDKINSNVYTGIILGSYTAIAAILKVIDLTGSSSNSFKEEVYDQIKVKFLVTDQSKRFDPSGYQFIANDLFTANYVEE